MKEPRWKGSVIISETELIYKLNTSLIKAYIVKK